MKRKTENLGNDDTRLKKRPKLFDSRWFNWQIKVPFATETQRYWNSLIALVESEKLNRAQLNTGKIWKNFDIKTKQVVIREFKGASERADNQLVILLLKFGIFRTQDPQDRSMESLSQCIDDLLKHEPSLLQKNLLALYYNTRGNLFNELHMYEKSISDLTKAIELHPIYSLALNNRANAYSALKMHPEALSDYSKAIELEPTYSSAFSNRGNLLCDIGRNTDGMDDYFKAIELDADNATAFYNRSITYLEIGAFVRAYSDSRTAYELDTSSDLYFRQYQDSLLELKARSNVNALELEYM